MLNSIWHELTSGVYTTTVFTWFTLAKVQLHGNDLGGFQIAWFSVLNEIENRPDEPSLMEMFLTQIRKSSIMTADLMSFDHLPLSHGTNVMHGWLQLSRNTFCNTKRNSLCTNTQDRPDNPILLFPAQADILTLLQQLLLREADRLRGVGFHFAGVQAQVVERESLHHGAETIGLTQSLSAGGAKVAHVMTDLTRVHIQLVGLTN